MSSERQQVIALISEEPYVSMATDGDRDSPSVKIIRISDDVSIAMKQADRGNDPLSIINQTGKHNLMNCLGLTLFKVAKS